MPNDFHNFCALIIIGAIVFTATVLVFDYALTHPRHPKSKAKPKPKKITTPAAPKMIRIYPDGRQEVI